MSDTDSQIALDDLGISGRLSVQKPVSGLVDFTKNLAQNNLSESS